MKVYSSFIDGKTLLPADITGDWKVQSPAKSEETFAKCVYSYSQIDLAIKAAKDAQLIWKEKSFEERMTHLQKGFQALVDHQAEWTQTAELELGRTAQDLQLEFKQLARWFDEFKKYPTLESKPRGVTAVVGSYVWPLFYTTHFAFLNLLAGNTVVIKPSEKSSICTLKWVEILSKDPVLAPCIQVLIGEKEVGRRLTCHDQIQTVIFIGSFEVGMRVKQDTHGQPAKEVLLYLDSKGTSILCEDFENEKALDAMIQDAFLSTGQHCRSASVIFVHQSRYSKFCDEFHERAKKFTIGAPKDKAFAGPLIDGSMLDRYLRFSSISEREGAQVLMRGKPLVTAEKGHFVTPTVVAFDSLTADQMKKSVSLQTEILSPHVSIIQYQSDEELLQIMAQMQHGLCVSIWGKDQAKMMKIADQLAVGEVLLNQSLLEWNPAKSFQARKKSGNHAYHGLRLIEQLSYLKSIQ